MRRPVLHNVLILTCVLQGFCVFVQGVLAGSFLSGADLAVAFHEAGGWITFGIAVIQLALLLGPSGRQYGIWLLVSSVGIAVAETLQLGTGYGRFLQVHIPLAILIVGSLVWQITWILKDHSVSQKSVDDHF